MKTSILRLVILLLCATTPACFYGVTGRVFDVSTRKPIEGAVVLVEWSLKPGCSSEWPHIYRIREMVTDSAGIVNIEPVHNLCVAPPDITVYRPGYVAWNSNYLFPGNRPRSGFVPEGVINIRLEPFNPSYSRVDHLAFIYRSVDYGIRNDRKRFFLNAVQYEKDEIAKEKTKRMHEPATQPTASPR